jgi:hypothetical protein
MNICNFCKKDFKNPGGLASHKRSCKDNPGRNPWKRESWNKGLTKETSEAVRRASKQPKGQTAWNKGKTGLRGTPHSEETKKRLSEVAKQRGLGGYVKGSGRGKKGWYRGIFCDSSWELAYLIYCIEHNITIERCTEKRKYIWKGKEENYHPDFKVDNHRIVEIKGYRTSKWDAKHQANPDIEVLFEKDLREVFDYVVQKYGKDFTDLYEGR